MSNLEQARELFKNNMSKYSTQNVIQLMQISDISHPGHKLHKVLRDLEYSEMIYEECQKELNKRLAISQR